MARTRRVFAIGKQQSRERTFQPAPVFLLVIQPLCSQRFAFQLELVCDLVMKNDHVALSLSDKLPSLSVTSGVEQHGNLDKLGSLSDIS
jgi:hypothetical protein